MKDDKCVACPECGCREYDYENYLGSGYRVCSECQQEWWTDIDYAIKSVNIAE